MQQNLWRKIIKLISFILVGDEVSWLRLKGIDARLTIILNYYPIKA